MKEKIDELKQAFRYAKTDKERDAIDVQMQQLINQNPDEFAQGMVDSAKETADEVTNLALRQKLESVIPAISLVYIAKKYFNKSDAWLYQRINGNVVNGKPAQFTINEIEQLKRALIDISNQLVSVSISL